MPRQIIEAAGANHSTLTLLSEGHKRR